jgi:hypothetical protein
MCFYHLILSTAALHSLTPPEPCDFVFDEQSKVGETALNWWGMFKHYAEHGSQTNFKPFLGSSPIFGNEKLCFPLQAADFYAWHINRWIWQNKKIYMPRPRPLLILDPMKAIEYEFTERKLIELRDFLIEIGRKFAEANPGVPLSRNRVSRDPAKWFPSGT